MIIIIKPRDLEISGLRPAENNHVSQAGEALFRLGWPSPRDGVSINILVVTQL